MKNPKIHIAIYLEKRKINSEGLHPVKLRITFQRLRKYYSLKRIPEISNIIDSELKEVPLFMTENDFEKINSNKPRGTHKEFKKYFNAIEVYVGQICSEIDQFSFDELEKKLFNKDNFSAKIEDLFQDKIVKLMKNKQIGTAKTYRLSLNSIQTFHNKKNLLIQNINVDFLNKYEKYMLEKGNSYTTIGIYLRNVRSIINEAIKKGILKQDDYPFGSKSDSSRYTIPKSKNIKKALTIEEIKLLFNYESESNREIAARDYWVFSYMCNGMNMSDVAHLKYENIRDNKIQFYRRKTINTSENKKLITIIITNKIQEIIDKHGNEKKDGYIFPIITAKMSQEEAYIKVSSHINRVNLHLKEIAKKIGIDANISTYWARHSFSTVLKRSGAPIAFISEQLGHHSLKTTDSYLDSFQDEVKEKYANVLIDF